MYSMNHFGICLFQGPQIPPFQKVVIIIISVLAGLGNFSCPSRIGRPWGPPTCRVWLPSPNNGGVGMLRPPPRPNENRYRFPVCGIPPFMFRVRRRKRPNIRSSTVRPGYLAIFDPVQSGLDFLKSAFYRPDFFNHKFSSIAGTFYKAVKTNREQEFPPQHVVFH